MVKYLLLFIITQFLISCNEENIGNNSNEKINSELLHELTGPDSTTVAVSRIYKIGQDTVLQIVKDYTRAHDRAFYSQLYLDSASTSILQKTISDKGNQKIKGLPKKFELPDTIQESRLTTKERLAAKYALKIETVSRLINDYEFWYDKEFPTSN